MYSGKSIQTKRGGVQLACQGSGQYKDWVDIRVSNNAVKNICFVVLFWLWSTNDESSQNCDIV